MQLFGLHASALADSPPHNKNTAPGHASLDFALRSVQLAVHYEPNVNLSYFLAELRRRNVYVVATASAIVIDRLSHRLCDDPRYNNLLAKVTFPAAL
jgi:hypothetical protein